MKTTDRNILNLMCGRYIPYYRVSTDGQGESGLGLEAQQMDVAKLIADFGGGKVLTTYTDIETGRNPDRPELAKAIAHAKLCNATLIVAKLDRLARNVLFVATLMESRVGFVCGDCREANTFTLHILAAVAEEEARKIAERTKKALAAAKARGIKLGSARPGHWDNREHRRGFKQATARSAVVRKRETDQKYVHLVPVLREMRTQGKTMTEIAAWLTDNGYTTRSGKAYDDTAVWRFFKRHAPECLGRVKARGVFHNSCECVLIGGDSAIVRCC